MPMKHLERGAFLCYFINLSVKLSKLEFAKLIIRYLSSQFYLA